MKNLLRLTVILFSLISFNTNYMMETSEPSLNFMTFSADYVFEVRTIKGKLKHTYTITKNQSQKIPTNQVISRIRCGNTEETLKVIHIEQEKNNKYDKQIKGLSLSIVTKDTDACLIPNTDGFLNVNVGNESSYFSFPHQPFKRIHRTFNNNTSTKRSWTKPFAIGSSIALFVGGLFALRMGYLSNFASLFKNFSVTYLFSRKS